MAYIDPDQPTESTSKTAATSNKSLYLSMKGKQTTTDYSDLIKMVITGIIVIFYIRPMIKVSSDLAIYELVALLCFGITGAFMARHKNNSLNGFFLGVLLCPLGLIMAAYLEDRTRMVCQHCAESIKKEAIVCPFCKTET